jgi:hypothetical protein
MQRLSLSQRRNERYELAFSIQHPASGIEHAFWGPLLENETVRDSASIRLCMLDAEC